MNISFRKYLFVGFLSMMAFLSMPFLALAGYDAYVDSSADDDGDGSKDAPYQSIEDALDEGEKDIYIKKGTYSEKITLKKDVHLTGEDREDVVVSGGITMQDDTYLEKLTVKNKGVFVSSGADVVIDNVTLTDIYGIAIETTGRGNLTVKNSKIHDIAGKGFYIQKDKDIFITNSEISKCKGEEGIDIRANVDGVISGNAIKDNGESGIEVILGSSRLKIQNNTIKNNGSSGIATQFYKSAEDLGDVRITNNELSQNSNYGIDCKAPSGGSGGDGYWENSITVSGNTFSDNKEGNIASRCHVKTEAERIAAAEAKQAALKAKKQAEAVATAEEAERKAQEEAEKKRQEEERKRQDTLQNQWQTMKAESENTLLRSDMLIDEIQNQSKFKRFFVGIDVEKYAHVQAAQEQHRSTVQALQDVQNQIDDTAVRKSIEEYKKRLEENIQYQQDFLETYRDVFSLSGWFKGLFGKEE